MASGPIFAPAPIYTPDPTVATPAESPSGMAPTTAFSPITTFSAMMQCSTTAPALMTVPPITTASSTLAPGSTITPANRTECFTCPPIRQPSVIMEFSTMAPEAILWPVIPLFRLYIFQLSSKRLIPLCSGSSTSMLASQREAIVPTSFQ